MDTAFLAELDRFTLLMKKRVSTVYTGARRSVKAGRGISPLGYREYRKGDDFKLVDWKVYGRSEKLYVREHEEERSLVLHVLLDASASMNYGKKFEYASMLAAGFSYMATRENEKFTISRFAERLTPEEPRQGRGRLLQAIEDLDRTMPQGRTNIKRSAEQFDKIVKTTSQVILISDFLDEPESLVNSIYRLSKNDLILIQVLDKAEADLSFEGDVRFVDLESEEVMATRVSPRLIEEYQEKMEDHRNRIVEACDDVGADFFYFTTDVPIFDAFSEVNSRADVWRGLR